VQLAQLRELKAKLDEDREWLSQLERALKRDQPHPHGRGARGCARELYQQIVGDEEPEPLVSRFRRAGQNIMAATMLLRNMAEPSNSRARRILDEVQGLLHVAAAQQAKSSASRHRGAATEKRVDLARNEREVSIHKEPPPRGKKTMLARSASSTIEGSATLDMTSTSTITADTGTLRSEATTLTMADVTIATRTEWLQSRRVLESLAGRSAARHYKARFDP